MMDKPEPEGKYKKPCVPGHYKDGSLGEAWETPVSVALVAPLEFTSDCFWVAETDDLHEHRKIQELAEAYQQLCAGLSLGLLHL